jgi:hypothetical protein
LKPSPPLPVDTRPIAAPLLFMIGDPDTPGFDQLASLPHHQEPSVVLHRAGLPSAIKRQHPGGGFGLSGPFVRFRRGRRLANGHRQGRERFVLLAFVPKRLIIGRAEHGEVAGSI